MAEKRYAGLPGMIQSRKMSKLEVGDGKIVGCMMRTSGLISPVIQIENHEGVINSCKFHPLGDLVMSAGYDKRIYIRNVFTPDGMTAMEGHTDSITEVQFSTDGSTIYSASLDHSVGVWDTASRENLMFLKGHKQDVNTVHSSSKCDYTFCSGSNDGTIRLWDTREPMAVQMLSNGFQVLSACFNDRGNRIVSGCVDGSIKIWDLRMNQIISVLIGHEEMVTGISMSPCGTYLLSTSLDNSIRVWDMKDFRHLDECIERFPAGQSFMEPNLLRCAWSKDSKKFTAGASTRRVTIWDYENHEKIQELEGHEDSVIDVDFHPVEPIIVSGSSYDNLFLHELQC